MDTDQTFNAFAKKLCETVQIVEEITAEKAPLLRSSVINRLKMIQIIGKISFVGVPSDFLAIIEFL